MCNPKQELQNAFKTAGNLVSSAIDTVGGIGQSAINAIENIAKNPLPVIEAVALTYVLGPEGLELASAGNAAIISNAAISAANGGKMEDIALAAGSAYLGAKVGTYAASQLGQGIDPIIKQVVASSSSAAATTALRGGSFNEILTNGFNASVGSYVNASLKANGYINADSRIIQSATSSAANAILHGKSISDAVGASVAATTINLAITDGISSLRNNDAKIANLSNEYNSIVNAATKFYNESIVPLQEQAKSYYSSAVAEQSNYEQLYASQKSAYDNYESNKYTYNNYDSIMQSQGYRYDEDGAYYRQGESVLTTGYDEDGRPYQYYAPKIEYAPTKESFKVAGNNYAQTVKDLSQPIADALSRTQNLASTYESKADELKGLQNKYQVDYINQLTPISQQIDATNQEQQNIAKGLGENVAKYETQLQSDAGDIAQQIASKAAEEAKAVVQQQEAEAARAAQELQNNQNARQAGFNNYADQQAAGNDQAPDFYAKKDGYINASEKSAAVNGGFTDPATYRAANKIGFDNATDYKAAVKGGFEDANTYKAATSVGFDNAKTFSDAKSIGAATNEDFNNKINEVKSDFQGKLGRDPTADELKSVISNGASTLQTAEKIIAPQYSTEEEVNKLFQDKLGRSATPEELMKFVGATPDLQLENKTNPYVEPLRTTPEEVKKFFEANVGRAPTEAELAKFVGATPDATTLTQKNAEDKLINGLDLPADYKSPDLKTTISRADAFAANRAAFGPGYIFDWTDPKTGITSKYTTYNEGEEAKLAQMRVDELPVYGGSRNTQTGRPESAKENIYIDKKTGDIINDTLMIDASGNVIGGSIERGYDSPTVTEATRILGNVIRTGLDVGSGMIKGGADALGQVGTLGALIGVVNPNNLLTETSAQIKAAVDSMRSNEFRGKEALMYDAIAKAGDAGFLQQVIETGKQFGSSPAQTAEFIVRNGMSVLVGAGAGAAFRAIGAGVSAAEVASIGAQAALQGAGVAQDAYEDALKNKKTPEEALNAARISAAMGFATSFLANKFIPGALTNEQKLAGEAMIKQNVSKALAGEMTAEQIEEVSGKIASNYMAGNPWDKDLGSTAVQALIGSGAVTGLANGGAIIGNIQTALAVAKDSGATDADLSNIKDVASSKLGSTDFGSKQPLNSIVQQLEDMGLGTTEAQQVGAKLQEQSVKDEVTTYLKDQGVAADKLPAAADTITNQILQNPTEGIKTMSEQLKTSAGMNNIDSTLAANQFLTGTDVKQEVQAQLEKQGVQLTHADLNNLIYQNSAVSPTQIASNVASYVAPELHGKTSAAQQNDLLNFQSEKKNADEQAAYQLELAYAAQLAGDPVGQAQAEAKAAQLKDQSAQLDQAIANTQKDMADSQSAASQATAQREQVVQTVAPMQQADAQIAADAKAAADAKIAEQTRIAQEAQAAQDAKTAEEAKTAQDAKAAEDARIAEEARVAEETKTANEKAAADQAAAAQAAADKAAADKAAADKAAADKAAADQLAADTAAKEAAKAAISKAPAQSSNPLSFGALSMALGSMPTGNTTISPIVPSQLTSTDTNKPFESVLANFEKLAEQPLTSENTYNQQKQESPLMSSPYYNYGQIDTIDSIMNPQLYQNGQDDQYQQAAATGGLITPLMAAGGITGTRHGRYAHGGMATPLMAAGGKMRVDFRHGDAVTGAGDGQSDDIPAMLADGEFVFPADVVAAIGNGSTKAGSDKLYDMMHGIRAHARSTGPKDLPPEIKSPLDFLKTKPRKAGRK